MTGNLLANVSGEWIEQMMGAWQQDPFSVSAEWRGFFEGYELAQSPEPPSEMDSAVLVKAGAVRQLIAGYRQLGHLLACTDPLSPCLLEHPLLRLSRFALGAEDLDSQFITPEISSQPLRLRDLIEILRETYCREIGIEFMHIQDPDEQEWLIRRMEPCRNRAGLSEALRLELLERLHQAALFEAFLHRRFVGQKRFSLEGAEILIPALSTLIRECLDMGVQDLVLGMAHRGRLNVLAHILGKPYEAIFAEFKETMPFGFTGDGDVKYHKGYSTELERDGARLHITLAANPSHLEAVNAVVEGKCRARQDRCADNDGANAALPVLIHGDASFAGQGSVMETLNMSRLEGYSTGGTIHIVLNNQIGFTTFPRDSRSTLYATDVAKMLACPVFHVQGEAPDAAVHVMKLAMEYRKTFGRDVVVEFICYRRHGHNEGDEPAFTQPVMYGLINGRPSLNRIYEDFLRSSGIPESALSAIEERVAKRLEDAYNREPSGIDVGYHDKWNGIVRDFERDTPDTAVSGARLLELARRLSDFPDDLEIHPKIRAMMQRRLESVQKGRGIDWGNAEILAYAALLDEGVSVRLSGQDSRRGTFNHRHCALVDMNDGHEYVPLMSVARNGAMFQAWNSLLSEFGVLGFEYGYSLETPGDLTLWEAQFGDFANGAQVIIDQFIASGETKWNRASGLVLLLPHGYEGQGGEHSSARIERFLQLSAGNNWIIVIPSTPGQMFHLLRRQVKQCFRKPLVVFTPKSLLRHPRCISDLPELEQGQFKEIIVDGIVGPEVSRVLFCSGKLYYELLGECEASGREGVVIVRIEQLYPLDSGEIRQLINSFSPETELIWVQEEPENMGAWRYINMMFQQMGVRLEYVGRPEDASPAVGAHHVHAEQQKELLQKAFKAHPMAD